MSGTTGDVVRGFIDALNSHDVDAIADRVTADFHNEHTSALGTSLHGREEYRTRLVTFLGGFTGLRYDIEDVLEQDSRAAVAYRMTFDFRCEDGTVRPIAIRGVFRFRVADGLIAHRVDYWDGADFQRQIAAGSGS